MSEVIQSLLDKLLLLEQEVARLATLDVTGQPYIASSGTGPPSSGIWNAGTFYQDTSSPPHLYYCTVGGTSGTWKQVTLT